MDRKFSDFPQARARETAGPAATPIDGKAEVVPPASSSTPSSPPRVKKLARATPAEVKGALAKIITEEDVTRAYASLVSALDATETRYRKDPGEKTGQWETVADWRVRLDAIKLLLAYAEGLPIQRTETVNVNIESKADLIERARNSPALARIAHRLFPADPPSPGTGPSSDGPDVGS